MKHHNAKVQFLEWLQANHPQVFARITKRQVMDGLSASVTAPVSGESAPVQESWWKEAMKSLPIITQAYREGKLIKANADRAAKGLPPINPSDYAAVVKVEHSAGGFDLQKSLPLIIGGIAAIVLLPKLLR